jgi:hypothetical protein
MMKVSFKMDKISLEMIHLAVREELEVLERKLSKDIH